MRGSELRSRRRYVLRRYQRTNFFWRVVFPGMIIVSGGAVAMLVGLGSRIIVGGTIGEVDDSLVVDPGEPGYLAFVSPTPSLLLMHTYDDSLVGITFLARPHPGEGSTALLFSSDLSVGADVEAVWDDLLPEDAVGDVRRTLGQAYEHGGVTAVNRLMEWLFGFGFTNVLEISEVEMMAIMTHAGPLPYELADNLASMGTDGVMRLAYQAGFHELDTAAAADIYSFRSPGEMDIHRVMRQKAIWEAWFNAISGRQAEVSREQSETASTETGLDVNGRGDDGGSVDADVGGGDVESSDSSGEENTDFTRLSLVQAFRLLVADGFTVEIVPMQPAMPSEDSEMPDVSVVLDTEGAEWLKSRVRELVPWPAVPGLSVHYAVQLLDGVGNPEARDALAGDIVDAGGVVTVVGNTEEFGWQETLVAYHKQGAQVVAESIATALDPGGKTIVPTFEEAQAGEEYFVDVTVVMGLDSLTEQ